MRNAEIDIIKGISIYLVVLGHLLDLIGDAAAWINLCHLAAFFFVSGFVLYGSLERHSIRDIVQSKTKVLLIPYLCWSGISLASNMGLTVIQSGMVSWEVFFTEAIDIFLHARSVWFLIQLLFAHYVFFLCRIMAKKEVPFWILSIAVYILLCFVLPDDWFQLILFKRLYGFFLLGYCIVSVPKLKNVCRRIPIRLIPLIACAYGALVGFYEKSGMYRQMVNGSGKAYIVFIGMAIGVVGVLLISMISKGFKRCRLGDALSTVGKCSIDVYVLHMFLVKFLPTQRMVKLLPFVEAYVLLILYATCIVAAIYYVAAHVLRRNKLYRISVGR